MTLTEEQLNYAAHDAYASLAIHQYLSAINAPCLLPPELTASTAVLLYNSDNTVVVAEGQISTHHNDDYYDGIHITSTRTVIDIVKILVPGALITTHGKRALNSFGSVPFSVVCLRTHLRTFDPTTSFQPDTLHEENSSELRPSMDAPEEMEFDDGHGVPLGDLLANELSPNSEPDNALSVDVASVALGEKILGPEPEVPDDPEFDSTLRSRVLKDPFHVFNMFYLSASHALRLHFT